MEQLYFEELEELNNELYTSQICKYCNNKCKIYSLSKDAEVYCNKYEKRLD